MTHDEFVKQYGRPPSTTPLSNVPSTDQAAPKSFGQEVSGGLNAIFGGQQIGESLVKAGTNIANLVTGGRIKYEQNLPQNTVDVPALIGDYGKAASNFIPGATEGAGLLTKTAVGAGTGYAMDVASNLKNKEASPFSPGLGTAVGGSLPVAGVVTRPATAILGRLMKGIGSGLSGVSGKTLDQILNNPEAAQKASQILAKSGGDSILEKNANTIVNGIGQVRQEARQAFGNALGELKTEDINPANFRQAIQPVLDKFGISTNGTERNLANVEFNDPKNIQKASNLIDELSSTKMDGKSLRNISNKIEDSKFKTATSDERLSFNAFLNELGSGVKNAINQSTDKLSEMNNKYTKDMQMVETMQNTFGKVKYKNLPEVVKASQQLESLFAKKGLAPQEIDKFLQRIGVSPGEFKTSEAVRQIAGKQEGANSIGLSPGELSREATSAIISPEVVKNLTIATGMTREKLAPFLRALKTPARNVVIQALLQSQQGNQTQESQ